jgi:Domain of unknown function (DUF5666)
MRSFYPFVLALIVSVSFATATAEQQDAQPTAQASSIGDKATAAQPAPEEMPVTVRPDASDTRKSTDTDPVLGVPPLPQGKTSMVGGKLNKIDRVHNKIGVKVFGGGEWNMAFDERTHFYRDDMETTFENIKKGDRVYVDTMLDGHRILARNVRAVTQIGPADARGQVTSFDGDSMSVRDDLSAQPVHFTVTNSTQVKRNGTVASLSDVQPGSLIAVQFSPDRANRGVAQSITILATPGQNFTFAGRVTHLDLHVGTMSVENRTDSKTYDLYFDREGSRIPSNLMIGSDVTVAAVFDGRQYKANSISVESASR